MPPPAVSEKPPQAQPPVKHAEPPDPYTEPVEYLRFHGWKCLGNPGHPSAAWLDPTKPLATSETKEPIMVVKPGETKPSQLMGPNGQPGGQTDAKYRVVVHPKGVPLDTNLALREQMERDARSAAEAAARAAK